MSKPLLIIVDDEPEIIVIVQYVGEMVGFEVTTATSVREFQKIWNKTEPSAIVMDLIMPDMDGHELLQWLVEQGCTAPILLMSGYDGKYLRSAEMLGKTRGAPIVGTFRKPIAVDGLKVKLKQILETVSKWTDDMSVGVDIIDADHKVLFRIFYSIQGLLKTDHPGLLKTGPGEETLSKALLDLREYTDYHFKREEALMEACDYPGLPNHREAHEKIIAKVERVILEAKVEPDILTAYELVEYLETWLQVHIRGMDKNYQNWMDGKDEIIRKTNLEFQKKRGVGKITLPNVA